MTKPKLSFWQIWNLSFGFLGVQIGYSLQNSNTSSIFESLGADVSHLSYFWLAAPLAGMIVQPIVGLFSDGTWTRWGRRIPYILGGSLISALALVLMPNCPKLLAFAPLAMGAFILLFMDSADDRTEVYQEGLYHVALCLLRIVEHVGHQRPEGLHRDV